MGDRGAPLRFANPAAQIPKSLAGISKYISPRPPVFGFAVVALENDLIGLLEDVFTKL